MTHPSSRPHATSLSGPWCLLGTLVLLGVVGCGDPAEREAVRSGGPAAPAESLPPAQEPDCPPCRISLELATTLGDDEEGLVGNFFAIARDGRGRYLTAFPEYGSSMAVFAADGTYLRSFGRSGQGPGEFRWIDKIRTTSDRIHVFDTPAQRRTILTLDFDVEGTTPLPAQPVDVEVLGDSLIAVNSLIHAADQGSHAIHLLDRSGRVTQSVGPLDGRERGSFLTSDLRALAATDGQRFWSMHRTRYLLELWTVTGEKLKEIELERPWLEPYEGVCCVRSPEEPPQPLIREIQLDSEGRLWVLATVAADDWWEGLVRQEEAVEGNEWQVADWDRFVDTMVEVIDPEDGRVLASERFDPWLQSFAAERTVASYVPAEGTRGPRVRVWTLSPAALPQER